MRKINLLALAIVAGSLTACGSGGGSSSDDAQKPCDSSREDCFVENQQVWVWDEENYDSFAHQKMAEVLEGWHVENLGQFERWTEKSISESSFTPLELSQRWAEKYYDLNDTFMSEIKPYILSIYEDFGASTNPDRYIANSVEAIEDIRYRFVEHYDSFIEPKFYPYPEAKEYLDSLNLLDPYFSQLDTIAVEVSMEIN